jgi:hypothetical protein
VRGPWRAALAALKQDARGASMLEFTIVFPVVALILFGTVDFGLWISRMNAGTKASHFGVRQAVVDDPVVTIDWTNLWTAAQIGKSCTLDDGTPNVAGGTPVCPSVQRLNCFVGNTAQGACNITAATASFQRILARMRAVVPDLQETQVWIEYRSSGLGFVGRPGGLPMEVSVGLRCRPNQFFFINRLANWAGAPAPTCTAAALPVYKATMIAEDMAFN